MTCTATHTVTQADLDAGNYSNTACVDDGPAGRRRRATTRTCRRMQNPHSVDHEGRRPRRATTRSATSSHYTIVATNDGNVTLHNVTVTDPNATT